MYNKSQNEAGPKAKIDVENFLKIYYFKIQDFYFYGGRRAELVSYRQSLFDIPFRLKGRYENAIFQYPALNERTNKAIIRNLKKNSQEITNSQAKSLKQQLKKLTKLLIIFKKQKKLFFHQKIICVLQTIRRKI